MDELTLHEYAELMQVLRKYHPRGPNRDLIDRLGVTLDARDARIKELAGWVQIHEKRGIERKKRIRDLEAEVALLDEEIVD